MYTLLNAFRYNSQKLWNIKNQLIKKNAFIIERLPVREQLKKLYDQMKQLSVTTAV